MFHSAWRMCSGSVTWLKHPSFYHTLLNDFLCLFFFSSFSMDDEPRLGRLGWTRVHNLVGRSPRRFLLALIGSFRLLVLPVKGATTLGPYVSPEVAEL